MTERLGVNRFEDIHSEISRDLLPNKRTGRPPEPRNSHSQRIRYNGRVTRDTFRTAIGGC